MKNRMHGPREAVGKHAVRANGIRWQIYALALGVAVVCFSLGRWSWRDTPAAKVRERAAGDLTSVLSAEPGHDTRPRPVKPVRNIRTPPLHLVQAKDPVAEEELRAYERGQSADLMKLLLSRTARIAMLNPITGSDEAVAAQLGEYMTGWIDAVVRTAPTLADDLSDDVEKALCDPKTTPAQLLVLLRLGSHMPEVTSLEGYECVLARNEQEDIVLWGALDSLRASGLPAPPAVAAVSRRAKDPRTLDRLAALGSGEHAQARAASPEHSVSDYAVPSAYLQPEQTAEAAPSDVN